jgi:hypothetical protein
MHELSGGLSAEVAAGRGYCAFPHYPAQVVFFIPRAPHSNYKDESSCNAGIATRPSSEVVNTILTILLDHPRGE